MRKFNAFTLAEVLITLGIIGVVAAMTMPTLMNQTNGAQYKAAYKKALSAIAQGVTLNVALDGGSFADTIAGVEGSTEAKGVKDDGTVDATKTGDTIASILSSRMNIVKATDKTNSGYASTQSFGTARVCKTNKPDCTADEDKEDKDVTYNTYLFFNDGTIFTFNAKDAAACTKSAASASDNKTCVGAIDVNGLKGPNKVVKCDQADATEDNCTVANPTDIYPVEFYDQTILPASPAAKAVLYGK